MSDRNSAMKTQKSFVKLSLWSQNHTHWHHLKTLSDQHQHIHLLCKNHCSHSFLLFLFSFADDFFFSKQLKQETLNLK